MRPSDWTIYPCGAGWFAWNARTRKRLDLVLVGTFSAAVDVFDSRIGGYYRSRPSSRGAA